MVRASTKSPAVSRILRRTSLALVRERIHDKRRLLDCNAKKLMALHLRIASVLSPLDWEFIDRVTTAMGEILLEKEKIRQKSKYDRLPKSKPVAPPLDPKRVVINLTSESFNEATFTALSKGLNFAPAPKTIPYLDYVGGIENAVRKLPDDLAEEVRVEVSYVLSRAVPPKPNISREERSAIRALRGNEEVTILPADKGNATVILKTEDYRNKIRDILEDQAYRKLHRDPTEAVTRKTISLIKKSSLAPEEAKNLQPDAPAPPRLYGLPKIHKKGVPLRPIVSSIASPTYNLAKYLTWLLSPYVGLGEHHVKNSAEFVNILDDIKVKDTDILVSLDVVSLFTRVPLVDTIELLQNIFDENTVKLFHHVLTSTYFKYDQEFFEQTDGVPMGSPLSPAIANFYMEHFEEKALSTAPLRPSDIVNRIAVDPKRLYHLVP
ncbi:uncharacterized protein LOC124164967 [Ischnura elegans]|uniref:uncharacterized protein LOC124164967 n=1 Tax=Ischnura elegans TaxID=197161 RepID=UPI001ED87D66|nr:uncharacterized protein LOC124164967 [Ischnura elegans]